MLRPYLKIWDWDLIFGCVVKTISSPGVRSLCESPFHRSIGEIDFDNCVKTLLSILINVLGSGSKVIYSFSLIFIYDQYMARKKYEMMSKIF